MGVGSVVLVAPSAGPSEQMPAATQSTVVDVESAVVAVPAASEVQAPSEIPTNRTREKRADLLTANWAGVLVNLMAAVYRLAIRAPADQHAPRCSFLDNARQDAPLARPQPNGRTNPRQDPLQGEYQLRACRSGPTPT